MKENGGEGWMGELGKKVVGGERKAQSKVYGMERGKRS